MKRLTYYLKQHTPLIHFEANKTGATLRATEVKPALDKYLIGQLGTDIRRSWMVGFGHNGVEALNYKLRITDRGSKHYAIESEHPKSGRLMQFPGYFANMGEKDRSKHRRFVFSTTSEQIVIQVQTLIPGIVSAIEQHLGGFFATHNFMTRKTKGFGSFTLLDEHGNSIAPRGVRSFVVDQGGRDEIDRAKRLFEAIELFYKAIRSGINLKGSGRSDVLYFKSLLFQYAKTHGHQWDKRKMRRDLFLYDRTFQQVERNRREEDSTVNYNRGAPYLYRDALGLASETQWLSYGKAKVKKEAKDIGRYPSPLTFKPIEQPDGTFRVYLLTRQDDDETRAKFFDTEFEVSTKGQSTKMKTPPAFDIDHYLAYVSNFFRENDFDDYVGTYERRAGRQVDLLYHIFNQLSEG